MTTDKKITVDLNRVQPHKVMKIHEGDVDSVFLVLTVTEDGSAVSLSGVTIKYDATIAGYLAEQDKSGSVSNNTIRIPITKNMTALPGTLKIDIRMISGTQVLYTQTVTMIVEKSVIDGSTKIDFDGTTIVGRLKALEDGFDDVEASVQTVLDKFPIMKEDIAANQVIKVKAISNDDATVNAAVDNYTAYGVSLEGRTNLMFCVNSGSNLRAQVRFDTLGYMKYRSQSKDSTTGEWNAWTDWSPIASGMNMANGAVSTAKIADGAVTTVKMADKAVTHEKLATGAVAAINIQAGSITADELAAGAVTSTELADGAVTEDKLTNFAVTASKLASGSVTTTKIAGGAVTTLKLSDSTVTANKLSTGAVITEKLADGAVTSDKIANGAVTLNKIPDEEITADKLAPGAVTTAKIADGAVTAAKIASGVIPTKTSDLRNDSGFVSDLSDYMKLAHSTTVDDPGQFYLERVGLSFDDVNLYLNLYSGAGAKRVAWYEDLPDISGKADSATTLSGYGITDAYTRSEIDEYFMELAPNTIPSSLPNIEDGQLFRMNGILALKVGDASDYIEIAKMSDIPTKTSDLTNDSGYITAHQDISNLMKYAPFVNTGGEVSALHTGQLFSYQGELGLKTEDDYILIAKKSNLPTRTSQLNNDSGFLTAHQDISGKADIEKGTIPSNHAWYTDESDGYIMTGNYTIIGDMCFMRATAFLIDGWERVYYSLPVAALASGSAIAVHNNDTFSIATGTQSNISVLEIKQIGSQYMGSGTISFTLIYKCS